MKKINREKIQLSMTAIFSLRVFSYELDAICSFRVERLLIKHQPTHTRGKAIQGNEMLKNLFSENKCYITVNISQSL